MISRRTLIQAAAAGGAIQSLAEPTLAQTHNPTTIAGIPVGVCDGSYRETPRTADQAGYIAAIAKAVSDSGAGLVELYNVHFEPPQERYRPAADTPPDQVAILKQKADAQRAALRHWRLTTPESYFASARRMHEALGVTPFAYSFVFTDDMTDPEIDTVFKATRALGCKVIATNGTKTDMAPRVAPFAARYGIDLGFHNHDNTELPNVGSIESFERVFAVSNRCKANLDCGHFVAANQDPIAFIEKNHMRITHIHLKDRKRDKGANLPWGQGDTPIREILLLVKRNGYKIPIFSEYEYYNAPESRGAIAENRKALAYMRSVLEA